MASRRLFVPGMSHHVWHRGNNKCDVFKDDEDRAVFLLLLQRAARRSDVKIHSYTLMDTHYHMLLTAPDEVALPRTMQRLGGGYVRYFNRRHLRTGTLWEGRYQASLIADERYWLTCMRYIELNPVQAGIVSAPELYPWSSYRHHAFGDANRLLSSHILYDALGQTAAQRQTEWRAMCGVPVSPEDQALIREALRTNSVLEEPFSAKSRKPAA